MSARGHIRKRGKKWAVVVDIGRDAKGRRIQKWHSGFDTKKAAGDALTEILGRLQRNEYVPPAKQTVESFLTTEWLPHIEALGAGGKLKPTTVDFYTSMVRTMSSRLLATSSSSTSAHPR